MSGRRTPHRSGPPMGSSSVQRTAWRRLRTWMENIGKRWHMSLKRIPKKPLMSRRRGSLQRGRPRLSGRLRGKPLRGHPRRRRAQALVMPDARGQRPRPETQCLRPGTQCLRLEMQLPSHQTRRPCREERRPRRETRRPQREAQRPRQEMQRRRRGPSEAVRGRLAQVRRREAMAMLPPEQRAQRRLPSVRKHKLRWPGAGRPSIGARRRSRRGRFAS